LFVGEKKRFVLNIPQQIWQTGSQNIFVSGNRFELTFLLKSIGEKNASEESNPATAVITNKNDGSLLQPLTILILTAISFSVKTQFLTCVYKGIVF